MGEARHSIENVKHFYIILDYKIKSDICADIFCASKSGEMLKTWLGVPAATQITSYFRSVSSTYVGQGDLWPTGETPPIANPVVPRIRAASALFNVSPTIASAFL